MSQTPDQPQQEHPGDVYTRSQIEDYFAFNLRYWGGLAEHEQARAAAAAPDSAERRAADQGLWAARVSLTEYEAGYAQWRDLGTLPWQLTDRFSRICGSVGGLDKAFAPPITVSRDVQILLELGLDPTAAPASPGPSSYQLASNEYHVRWQICQDAMRRWGWWLPGDEPTADMRAQWAAEDAAAAEMAAVPRGNTENTTTNTPGKEAP